MTARNLAPTARDASQDDDRDRDDAESPFHPHDPATRSLAASRWLVVTAASDGRHVIRCHAGECFVSRVGWCIYRTHEGLADGGGLLARLVTLPMVRVAAGPHATIVEFPLDRFPGIIEWLRPLPAPDRPSGFVPSQEEYLLP